MNLSKSETAVADISNRENLCCGTMFHFFFFFLRKPGIHWGLWVRWDTDGASQMWSIASISQ